MSEYPKVTVLILSYNGKIFLDDCISSYLGNDYPNFDLVVIDNGSNDGTKEHVETNWPEIKVIRSDNNLKYAGGFNFGLDFCFNKNDSDFALITNNDVVADKSCVTELVSAYTSITESCAFVTGKVYYNENRNVLQTVGKAEHKIRWNGEHIGNGEVDIGQYDTIAERIFIDDIFMLVGRDIYHGIGGYDPVFGLQCEEWDWQARAKQKGYNFLYTPNAKIWHKESMTIGKRSSLKAYYDARNPILVVFRYKTFGYFFRFLIWHIYSNVLKGVLKAIILESDRRKAKAILSGLMSGIMLIIRDEH